MDRMAKQKRARLMAAQRATDEYHATNHEEHALMRETHPKPDHHWNSDDGHDCTDCAPDSMWKCDAAAHVPGHARYPDPTCPACVQYHVVMRLAPLAETQPQPPLSPNEETRVREVIASELHLAHPYDRALLASLDRERVRVAEQYVLGHRHGVRCGAENVGFGTTECDHVGSWRLTRTGPFDELDDDAGGLLSQTTHDLREAIDAVADALNAWDQGEPPRPDTHRHWSRIVSALSFFAPSAARSAVQSDDQDAR